MLGLLFEIGGIAALMYSGVTALLLFVLGLLLQGIDHVGNVVDDEPSMKKLASWRGQLSRGMRATREDVQRGKAEQSSGGAAEQEVAADNPPESQR